MNKLEYEMIEVLKELKEKHGVFEIKAEFENEGSRMVELIRLKDIADKAGLPIILKIGGAEAVSDIYQALTLGAKGIVAPMVETPYAVSKFLDAIEKFVPEDNRKDIEFAINIETITAHDNIEKILNLEKIHLLNSVTVGRVDFTGSMGEDRDYANGGVMFSCCEKIFKEAIKHGLHTALGGAISLKSKVFIKTLISMNLLDKFETRKIVYGLSAINNIEEALSLGIKFELLWLKSKKRYYHRINTEDDKRIKMLEERLK